MTIQEMQTQNFRYTFQKQTLTSTGLTEGLYTLVFRKAEVVVAVDKFGEARVAIETPVNNERKLAAAFSKI